MKLCEICHIEYADFDNICASCWYEWEDADTEGYDRVQAMEYEEYDGILSY